MKVESGGYAKAGRREICAGRWRSVTPDANLQPTNARVRHRWYPFVHCRH